MHSNFFRCFLHLNLTSWSVAFKRTLCIFSNTCCLAIVCALFIQMKRFRINNTERNEKRRKKKQSVCWLFVLYSLQWTKAVAKLNKKMTERETNRNKWNTNGQFIHLKSDEKIKVLFINCNFRFFVCWMKWTNEKKKWIVCH